MKKPLISLTTHWPLISLTKWLYCIFLLCIASISQVMAQDVDASAITAMYPNLPSQIQLAHLKTEASPAQHIDEKDIRLNLYSRENPLEIGLGVMNRTNRKVLLTLLDKEKNIIYECRIQTGRSIRVYNLREFPAGQYTLKLLSKNNQITRNFTIQAPAKPQAQIVF